MPSRLASPLVPAGDLVAVLTTLPTAAAAQSLADTLVRERLAACVNALPGVASTYEWQGQLTHDVEVLCLIKTQRDRLPALVTRLHELHTYEVPEVVVLGAEAASRDYWQWLRAATTGAL